MKLHDVMTNARKFILLRTGQTFKSNFQFKKEYPCTTLLSPFEDEITVIKANFILQRPILFINLPNLNYFPCVGAMTGGGRARRGGMGTKVTAGLVNDSQPDNTPQLKKSIEEYERRVAKLVPSIAASERQEEKIRNQIYKLEDEHRILSMDIQVSGLTIFTFYFDNNS
jgi:hypothetical protein